MKYIIDVPEFDVGEGLRLQWEFDFHISVKVDKMGTVVITANSAGLTSLARHLLLLAQESVPKGRHLHLDPDNALDEGSSELIIERT